DISSQRDGRGFDFVCHQLLVAPSGQLRSNRVPHSSGQSAGSYNLTDYRYQAGSFFTTVFLGLQVWIWLILLVLVVAAVVGAMLVRRRRPGVGAPPPGWAPPQQPPSGPEPPGSPP